MSLPARGTGGTTTSRARKKCASMTGMMGVRLTITVASRSGVWAVECR